MNREYLIEGLFNLIIILGVTYLLYEKVSHDVAMLYLLFTNVDRTLGLEYKFKCKWGKEDE